MYLLANMKSSLIMDTTIYSCVSYRNVTFSELFLVRQLSIEWLRRNLSSIDNESLVRHNIQETKLWLWRLLCFLMMKIIVDVVSVECWILTHTMIMLAKHDWFIVEILTSSLVIGNLSSTKTMGLTIRDFSSAFTLFLLIHRWN
jgi:hypothetical protein